MKSLWKVDFIKLSMCSFETTWSRSSLLWWVTSDPGTYSAILVKLLTLAWNAEVCWTIVRISKTHQYVQNNQAPHPADSLQLVWFWKVGSSKKSGLWGPRTETGLQPTVAQWLDGYSSPPCPTALPANRLTSHLGSVWPHLQCYGSKIVTYPPI